MSFCIIPQLAEKLKAAAIRGEMDIDKLFDMTSKERRALFHKYADLDTATQINAGFEKAMISDQQNALKKWAEKVFNSQGKKTERYKGVIKKIIELDELGVLNPEKNTAFLEDLVAEKLGATVTQDEARIISEKTKKVQDAAKLPLNHVNQPPLEYWSAKRELNDYLHSLVPSSQLKVVSSIVRRGSMLMSVKAPVLNIESNTVQLIGETLSRRIESLTQGRILSAKNKHATSYWKYANEVFNKTGYDITRMFTFDDGLKNLGEERVQSQGKGVTRKIGRFFTDIVFDKLMTAPDVAFSSYHFVDSATLKAAIVARQEGLEGKAHTARVEELFLDAARIDPQTPQGRAIRDKAIADAQMGTYTNDSQIAKAALKIREALNTYSGDFRLGDQLSPFVKTPANVVGVTIDYSGVFLPLDTAKRTLEGVSAWRRGDADGFKKAFDRVYWRKVVRAGLGLSIGFLLSGLFEPDDYIGEYPISKKEQELLDVGNANTNSLKIGDKWISLDYFGPLGAPFVGFMSARKYATSTPEAILRYMLGGATQLSRTPGFKQFRDLYESVQKNFPDRTDPDTIKNSAANYLVDYLRSYIPAIVKDFARGSDRYQREVEKGDVWARVKQDIPFIRESLAKKTNIFGEFKEGEGLISTLFFGSRVKSVNTDKVVQELERLAQVQNLPSITDVSETSPRAKELKKQIGEREFRTAMIEFGQAFKEGIQELVDDPDYQELADDEKKNEINNLKEELFEEMLDTYGYEKEEE